MGNWRVEVLPDAHATIMEAVSNRRDPGDEVGGWLLSHRVWSGNLTLAVAATGPFALDAFSSSYGHMDIRYGYRAAKGTGLTLCGRYHVHPYTHSSRLSDI